VSPRGNAISSLFINSLITEFKTGDTATSCTLLESAPGWVEGTIDGLRGLIPGNYFRVVKTPVLAPASASDFVVEAAPISINVDSASFVLMQHGYCVGKHKGSQMGPIHEGVVFR
jgi:hypothetical protein